MMERVYLIEDGLSYGERAVFGLLSALGRKGKVFLQDGLSSLSEDLKINKGSLLYYLRSLEEKGYLEINRRRLPSRIFVADIKLNFQKGKWIRVPRSFLLVGSPKERGLLLTLTSMAKTHKLPAWGVKVKKTSFYLKDLISPDAKSPKTLRKLLRSLQSKGFILVERTRPFYVVRVIA